MDQYKYIVAVVVTVVIIGLFMMYRKESMESASVKNQSMIDTVAAVPGEVITAIGQGVTQIGKNVAAIVKMPFKMA